jgi:hypothetical protein
VNEFAKDDTTFRHFYTQQKYDIIRKLPHLMQYLIRSQQGMTQCQYKARGFPDKGVSNAYVWTNGRHCCLFRAKRFKIIGAQLEISTNPNYGFKIL